LLIDTHAHLDMDKFSDDLGDVIKRSKDAGVGYIITIGADAASSVRAAYVAEKHEGIFFAPGVHPHDVRDMTESGYETIRELALSPKAVAVGETGLDYFYDLSPRDVQRKEFARQINLARELEKPLIIHSRDANKDTMDVMEAENAREAGGTLHCFSGDYEMAKRALDMGFFISVGGVLTFRKSDELRGIIKKIPIERILLETDCPYLAPQPKRGKRNEPAFLPYVAEVLAEVKGLSVDDIGRITGLNAMGLFGMAAPGAAPVVAYPIRNSLYLNITNRCTNACSFCVRSATDYVKGHNLRLPRDPEIPEILEAMKGFERYYEVVFCGYGEPFMRLDVILAVAAKVKEAGVRVRVNTNGHALLIHGREFLPKLTGLVDALSVSLNYPTESEYIEHCRPIIKGGAYDAMKEFVVAAKVYVPEVVVTVVDMPGVDVESCRRIAEDELGVPLRVRHYNEVG